MMKQTLTLFLLVFVFLTSKCQPFQQGWWQTFEGKVGAASVQLSLYNLGGGQIKGNYCYKTHESKLQLDGKVDHDKVNLTETQNGKVNGYFTGSIDKEDSLTGTWTNSAKTKSFPFRMRLTWASAAPDFSHRYANVSESDRQVEAFMATAKAAVLKGEKQWLADNIHYPISIVVHGKKVNIVTKDQLLNNFSGIFPATYKNKVSATCTCNLFSNTQGIMLGKGEIWIDDFAMANGKTRLFIKVINNQ